MSQSYLSDAQIRRAGYLRERIKCFRVLIIGRANAGKTTILQRVCNTTEDPKIFNRKGKEVSLSEVNPTARRGEHVVENEMIFKSNPGFIFHDSRGFEAGGKSELDAVKNFIQCCSQETGIGEQLHVIWYCIPINDEARPITRAELNFFAECGTGTVPVIVVFTKADLLDARTIKQLVKAGFSREEAEEKAGKQSVINFQEKFGEQLYAKKYPPKTHVYFRDMQHTTSDCSPLIEKTAAVLSDDTILKLFFSVQQVHLSLTTEYAIENILLPKLSDLQGFKRRVSTKKIIGDILTVYPHISVDNRFAPYDGVDTTNYAILDDLDHTDEWEENNGSAGQPDDDWDYISVYDAVQCPHWTSIGDTHTSQNTAFLGIATVIIAEHSVFLWKNTPSTSTKPIEMAIKLFKSSTNFTNTYSTIQKLYQHRESDLKSALQKIAFDNRLSSDIV